MSTIDMQYQPATYFWPLSIETHLLATVKGAARQRHIRYLIAGNRLHELQDWMAKPSLTPAELAAAGRVDQVLLGGERLPDLRKGEVEIARITLRTDQGNVISIRAQKTKSRIRYRVVDEFKQETLTRATHWTRQEPLKLHWLEGFIEAAGAGMAIVRFNLEQDPGPPARYRGFLRASSAFYPDLTALYEQRFEALLQRLCAGNTAADSCPPVAGDAVGVIFF